MGEQEPQRELSGSFWIGLVELLAVRLGAAVKGQGLRHVMKELVAGALEGASEFRIITKGRVTRFAITTERKLEDESAADPTEVPEGQERVGFQSEGSE